MRIQSRWDGVKTLKIYTRGWALQLIEYQFEFWHLTFTERKCEGKQTHYIFCKYALIVSHLCFLKNVQGSLEAF